MDEEGQNYMVAYCSDRYTENSEKQFCIESQLHWKHLGAFAYGVQVGLHDFVCAEVYSLRCQGYPQEENYSSLT